jgi:hypothetical protein
MTLLHTVRLTRSANDRRLYAVKGVGTLRLTGLTGRAATVEAGGRNWQITHRGIWRPVVQAADAAGAVVGEFRGGSLERDRTLQWANRALALRRDRARSDRYILREDDHKLVIFDGKGLSKRRVDIIVNEAIDIDPGLLLFSIFVIQTLAPKLTPWR